MSTRKSLDEIMSELATPLPRINRLGSKIDHSVHRGVESVREDTNETIMALGTPMATTKVTDNSQSHKQEQTWFRSLAYFLASGMSEKEAAQQLGLEPHIIRQAKRTKEFQVILSQVADISGQEMMMALLKGEAVSSIMKLVDLRDTAKSEQVQFNATVQLLDRYLGKPKQSVEVEDKRSSKLTPEQEAQELAQEIAAIQTQLQVTGRVLPLSDNQVSDPSLTF